MNRKHNPMLSLAALVLLAMILALICGGCYEAGSLETQAQAEATEPMEPVETQGTTESEAAPLARFTIEWTPKLHGELYIITDNETGIQYLAFETGHGVGMTQLLPGEG